MRLDTKVLRYLTNEDWRVLTAVETGSRNHEVVPTPLIASLSGFKGTNGGGVQRSISILAKANLIAKVKNVKYDGYRLTYGGLDHLALHAHTNPKTGTIYSLGPRVGVGKESDIHVVASPAGRQLILKVHRLGRISFRTVKVNRDYRSGRKRGGRGGGGGGGGGGGWMCMSRLAAVKEFAFMKAIYEDGRRGERGGGGVGWVRVPEPIAQNRHTVVMELVDGVPLRQVKEMPDPPGMYAELVEIVLRLAGLGLVHGDFNEFNIIIKEEREEGQDGKRSSEQLRAEGEDHGPYEQQRSSRIKLVPVIIDFPQMVSMDHPNATFYFDRDVRCIKRFFERRFGFVSDASGPDFTEATARLRAGGGKRRLDVEVEASGFSRKMAKELEEYMREVGVGDDGERSGEQWDGEDEVEEEEGEEEEEEEEEGIDSEQSKGADEEDSNHRQADNVIPAPAYIPPPA